MKRLISGILIAAAALVFANATTQASETTMTADELRTALVGKTLPGKNARGKSFKATIKENGRMEISIGVKTFNASWEIMADGVWCREISGKRECAPVKRDGNTIIFHKANGKISSTVTLN